LRNFVTGQRQRRIVAMRWVCVVAHDDIRTAGPTPLVLVVEDDAFLRSLTAEYLEDCDFSVLQAETADEAVQLLRANGQIDAVFSDVQLPGSMDGIDLAEWIGRELPRVKVLLTSGRVARDQVGDWPLLAKPYRLGELEGQLRAFLDPE
jgi:CheY-like chemotaxis protein